MIAFLEGTIEEKQPTRLVLNVGGVGYAVAIPLSSYDRFPGPGATCRVLTHEYIREDRHDLFGFATPAEQNIFERLLNVTGIGPRIALGALSGLSPREFVAAVSEGDVQRLSRISGIGKKTAERIVVELRDKIEAGEALEAIAGGEPAGEEATRRRDAVLALIALGYKQADAQRMVRAVPASRAGSGSVEDLVRAALTGR